MEFKPTDPLLGFLSGFLVTAQQLRKRASRKLSNTLVSHLFIFWQGFVLTRDKKISTEWLFFLMGFWQFWELGGGLQCSCGLILWSWVSKMDIGNCKHIHLLGKVCDVRLRFYFKELFLLTSWYKRALKWEQRTCNCRHKWVFLGILFLRCLPGMVCKAAFNCIWGLSV